MKKTCISTAFHVLYYRNANYRFSFLLEIGKSFISHCKQTKICLSSVIIDMKLPDKTT